MPDSIELTRGEKQLVKWQYSLQAGFDEALWQAIYRADGLNLEKLEMAFPEEVQAYRRFSNESGYWQKVRTAAAKQGLI